MTNKRPKKKARVGVDEYGRTALHYAVIDKHVDAVIRLIEEKADPNAQDDDGWSPLHYAAQVVSPEIATILLRSGANVELRDSYGNTPLCKAVLSSQGVGTVIGLLREARADPFSANNHGVTPVGLARNIGNYDVAQFFKDLP